MVMIMLNQRHVYLQEIEKYQKRVKELERVLAPMVREVHDLRSATGPGTQAATQAASQP